MVKNMIKRVLFFFWIIFFLPLRVLGIPVTSVKTSGCLGCHSSVTPGIVHDWLKSSHALHTIEESLQKSLLERKLTISESPLAQTQIVVGCAECHTANPEKHGDTFDHNGYHVHPVVTPEDCAICHPAEFHQYTKNLMSHAYANLVKNPVYSKLLDSVNSFSSFTEKVKSSKRSDEETDADSCLHCHGTYLKVNGMRRVETPLGEMSFPVLSGWPNQGVGRVNPDNSLGACTSCHPRHSFSIEVARRPEVCSECHKGPDVPAYSVYSVSKHGNIYNTFKNEWNFKSVPWTIGRDFTAPTCAGCHVSLLVTPEGEVVSERTHQMNDRLGWRIFGLIYAHAHPLSPDTTIIKNLAGLPLPTELTGEQVKAYLIDKDEQRNRLKKMQQTCLTCHSTEWVEQHFNRFENTIATTNELTLNATKIINAAWSQGIAKGLSQNDSIFNEGLEKKWVEQWLFFANSTRFASAMMGADYGVFANGRWYLNKNLQEMEELFQCELQLMKSKKEKMLLRVK